VVAPQYTALAAELAAIRQASAETVFLPGRHPVKGDPFRDFAGFASQVLTLETSLRQRAGVTAADLETVKTIELDMFAASWRATIDECRQVLQLLADGRAMTVRELLLTFPAPRRRLIQTSLSWMAKHGFLDWL
jgi:hypothetical protein